jgi:DNA-binding response OmpR family regulator
LQAIRRLKSPARAPIHLAVDSQLQPLALVADDDPDLLRLASYQLRVGGFRTTTATDGLEALKKIVAERPDVVVLDVAMPGLDGDAVLRITTLSDDPPPVLFLTAYSDDQHLVDAFEHGAVDYMTKPVRAAELVARCKAAIRR